MIRYRRNVVKQSARIIVDGKEYQAKFVGKGQFSRVYRVGDRVIYYTRGDCGKEVLSMFQYDRITHLPEMIRHENITMPRGRWYVFSSPYYRNVKRTDTSAYTLMKIIIKTYEKFWSMDRDYQYQAYGRVHTNIYVMQRFVDYIRDECSYIPRSVVKALQEVVNVASNCGGVVGFDLHVKNFGVNEYGTLIFRDPFYVRE